MAKVGAQRAAILTGKSKSTIQRAMNGGKLSFELDQNKRRVIDVSELERVFGIKQQTPDAPAQIETREITDAVEKERMKMQIRMLEQQLMVSDERLTDLTDQRDKWEKQASQILITSQYSQKQAEELRAQIKEREDRVRQRRLQNAQVQKAQSRNSTKTAKPMGAGAKKLDEKMKKLKAENENTADYSNSVFRFWKRAKS
ncbi:MAG: entry exclusion 1 domain-containing protein [Zetaproteobacteria bacterium]|nr:MAG: entry exclusion 1 domain-containing protein [Zetaproteobacteria bacterium]